MKYLRKFSEGQDSQEVVKSLLVEARQYLAYLLDGDWNITIWESGYGSDYKYYSISIDYTKEDEDGGLFFSLSKVRNEILPYLEFMMSKYDMKNDFLVYYYNRDDIMKNFTKEELERKNMKISYILFKVKICDI